MDVGRLDRRAKPADPAFHKLCHSGLDPESRFYWPTCEPVALTLLLVGASARTLSLPGQRCYWNILHAPAPSRLSELHLHTELELHAAGLQRSRIVQ